MLFNIHQKLGYPGYKVVEGRSNRRYISEDAVADAVSQAGYDPYSKKVLGLTVYSDGRVIFTFRNGTEITTEM